MKMEDRLQEIIRISELFLMPRSYEGQAEAEMKGRRERDR